MKKVALIFICLLMQGSVSSYSPGIENIPEKKSETKIYINKYALDELVFKLNSIENKLNLLNEDLTKYYDSIK